MNKKELVDAMAKEAQLPKNKTEEALNAFMKVVNDAMKKNDRVVLVGFGTFEVANRKARNGCHAQHFVWCYVGVCAPWRWSGHWLLHSRWTSYGG